MPASWGWFLCAGRSASAAFLLRESFYGLLEFRRYVLDLIRLHSSCLTRSRPFCFLYQRTPFRPRRIFRFPIALPFVVVSLCWWNAKDVLSADKYVRHKLMPTGSLNLTHQRFARATMNIARRQIYFCVILMTTKICFSAVSNHELCIMSCLQWVAVNLRMEKRANKTNYIIIIIVT